MVISDSSIFIRRMRIYAFHGVMPQEQQVGGWFVVSIRVHYNYSLAIDTDEVEHTISYADVCEMVKREMAVPSKLLEHVAGRIGRAVKERWPETGEVDIWLTKENPPMGADCEGAGVELHLL